MGLGSIPIFGVVIKPSQIQMRVGHFRIELQSGMIGALRLFDRGDFALQSAIEPFFRAEVVCRDFCRRTGQFDLSGETLGIEIKNKLAGVRLPARLAVQRNDPFAVGVNFDARKVLLRGQLALERCQHAHDCLGRNARIEQASGSFKQEEILKRELELFFFIAARCDKSGAHKSMYPAARQAQNFRHLGGGEKFHFLAD
jgi:hypothetical protein